MTTLYSRLLKVRTNFKFKVCKYDWNLALVLFLIFWLEYWGFCIYNLKFALNFKAWEVIDFQDLLLNKNYLRFSPPQPLLDHWENSNPLPKETHKKYVCRLWSHVPKLSLWMIINLDLDSLSNHTWNKCAIHQLGVGKRACLMYAFLFNIEQWGCMWRAQEFGHS